jgi:hypothetical protein
MHYSSIILAIVASFVCPYFVQYRSGVVSEQQIVLGAGAEAFAVGPDNWRFAVAAASAFSAGSGDFCEAGKLPLCPLCLGSTCFA